MPINNPIIGRLICIHDLLIVRFRGLGQAVRYKSVRFVWFSSDYFETLPVSKASDSIVGTAGPLDRFVTVASDLREVSWTIR